MALLPTRRVPIVLVCDPDDAERQAIVQALSAVGIEVKAARDGGRALEISVLEQPDLVVFDAESGVLDPARFCEILRGNPRTEATPVLVIGHELRGGAAWARGPDAGGTIGLNATFVPRPFSIDAVALRVRELLRSRTAAVKVAETAAASVVQGNLADIPLVDLLQIFVMNRKEGRLLLSGDPGGADAQKEGEVHLKGGQLLHARMGGTEGAKALYRMLDWKRGRFQYQPGPTSAVRTIKSAPDAVVMEGMRQSDELARLAERRPPDGARVIVTMDRKGLPEDLHRVTREVLSLTEFYGTVGEILDRAAATDFEALRALILLADKGVLYFDATGVDPVASTPALVDGESIAKLRGRSAVNGVVSWKVVVFVKDRAALRRFLGPFARVQGFVAVGEFFDPSASATVRPPIGLAAKVPLADGHMLEVVACPTGELYRPLLGLFGERALAGIVIQEEGAAPEGTAALAAQIREALGTDAIPLDLGTFAPVVAPPSDGSVARALITEIVATALAAPSVQQPAGGRP